MLLYAALVTVFRSASAVETHLSDHWSRMRRQDKRCFPDRARLPKRPPRRHHWQAAKARITREQFDQVRDHYETHAALTAVEAGLLGTDRPLSLTHPSRLPSLYGDGKVFKALTNYATTDTWTDEHGQIHARRADPDSAEYQIGVIDADTGKKTVVYGVKMTYLMARGDDPHHRVPLGSEPDPRNDEVACTLRILDRVAPRLPGAEAFIYDRPARHPRRLHPTNPRAPSRGPRTTEIRRPHHRPPPNRKATPARRLPGETS